MPDNFWDTITGLGSSAYDYVTDTDFSGGGGSSTGLLEDIGSVFTDKQGNIDGSKVAGGVGSLVSLLGSTGVIDKDSELAKFLGTGGPQKTGYLGEIPNYTASRQQVPQTYDPTRRPGSAGQRYFTDVDYSGGDTSGSAAALQTANLANPAQQNRAGESLPVVRAAAAAQAAKAAQTAAAAQAATNTNNTQALAAGGIAGLNIGGDPRMAQMMAQPRYLSGSMDGMADTIPASIDGQDPAALSGGEFVVPADVVSGMGNGNSDAGAKNLYAMMDKVRQARTGMKKQPPAINPNQMLPNMRA
tara:strand:- start:380 stop:1282 length:903 start_codon:yes stop_codon:yes gene_type:complete